MAFVRSMVTPPLVRIVRTVRIVRKSKNSRNSKNSENGIGKTSKNRIVKTRPSLDFMQKSVWD